MDNIPQAINSLSFQLVNALAEIKKEIRDLKESLRRNS